MKKRASNPLNLHRETLRALTSSELAGARGELAPYTATCETGCYICTGGTCTAGCPTWP